MNVLNSMEMLEAHDNFIRGEGLTDSEVIALQSYYSNLHESIKYLGEEFSFAKNEIASRLNRLNDVIKWRKLESG